MARAAEHQHKRPTATKDSKVFLSADELKSLLPQYVSRFGLTRVCLLGWFCCECCLRRRLRRSLAIFSSGLFSFASVSLVHEEVLLSFFFRVCLLCVSQCCDFWVRFASFSYLLRGRERACQRVNTQTKKNLLRNSWGFLKNKSIWLWISV